MKAVILAGGLGLRLRPFTEAIPKPLLPIGERAILEIQIERLKKFGFDEIFLATNYKSKYIENFIGDGSKYKVNITISKEEKPLGTVGPVVLIRENLIEPFLLMNGDILSLVDFAKFYNFSIKREANLTVAVKEIITPFQFGNIRCEGDYITGIEEKPDIRTKILAGIYVLKPGIFDIIPKNEYFGMDLLIKKMLKLNMPIAKYEINEYWLDIGNIEDFNKAQEIYHEHFKE